MTDYDRIAAVIRHVATTRDHSADLATLAAVVNLSPAHFHRIFHRWAGVTPKNFLRCLAADNLVERLRTSRSVLDATFDLNLSSPGRLHDLCVLLEAASPGEIRSGGAGLTLSAGFADSPFGRILVADGPRGICHLAFLPVDQSEPAAWATLVSAWPAATIRRSDITAAAVAHQIFEPVIPSERITAAATPPLRAFVRGTPFQVRVWRALVRVPPGTLISYRALAAAAGHPRAVRATASAVANNSVAALIPCHRVIRESGALGGYRWDPVRKQAMIAREATTPSGANDSTTV